MISGFSILLVRAVDIAFEVYFGILFLRVLFSWIRMNPYGKFYQFVFSMTEPLLGPIRRYTMRSAGMPLDFSPMILMLIIIVVQRIVMSILYAILL